ncbi:MAG TPA: coenzyme F420-0:L-glutamate ligase [Methanobacterium sp.]
MKSSLNHALETDVNFSDNKKVNLPDNKKDYTAEYFDKEGYRTISVNTGYIKPGDSYDVIVERAAELLEDGDFLVISETPIAVSQGRLVDEAHFEPSLLSFFMADIWSKYIWGYALGPLFRIKKRTIKNLRRLPPEARSHKQLILKYYGIKHALKPASEAGVDLSNVPGTFVCLLPENPQEVVSDISRKIESSLEKSVTVMIIDTDATYQLFGFKFTSIPQAVPGITRDLGFFGYILGRLGKIIGPTPLAVSKFQEIDKILQIAKVAEEHQKKNEINVETVYDMKEAFEGELGGVTVEMLESIPHTPAVIVRTL